MAPKRPGGKYKGKIQRAKGEATLAAEAAQKAKKAQEEYIRRMQEKRQRELMAGHGLSDKEAEEEAKKQRALNLLMGGKKGNAKKFFRGWAAGVQIVKKERLVREREEAWRRSCCDNHRSMTGLHLCMSHGKLRDGEFELPFDAMRRLGLAETLASPTSALRKQTQQQQMMNRSSSVPGHLPALEGSRISSASTRLDTPDETSPVRQRVLFSPDISSQSESRPLSPGQRRRGGLRKGAAAASPSPPSWGPEPFVKAEDCEVAVHFNTGRRCMLDRNTMRVMFADLFADPGTWSTSGKRSKKKGLAEQREAAMETRDRQTGRLTVAQPSLRDTVGKLRQSGGFGAVVASALSVGRTASQDES